MEETNRWDIYIPADSKGLKFIVNFLTIELLIRHNINLFPRLRFKMNIDNWQVNLYNSTKTNLHQFVVRRGFEYVKGIILLINFEVTLKLELI